MALSGNVTFSSSETVPVVLSSVAPSLVNKTLAKMKEGLVTTQYISCAVGLNYKDFS